MNLYACSSSEGGNCAVADVNRLRLVSYRRRHLSEAPRGRPLTEPCILVPGIHSSIHGPLLGRLDGPTPTPVRGQRYPRRRVAFLSATPPRRRRVFDVLMECYIADLLHRQLPAASVKPGGVVRTTDRCPDICHRLTSVSRTHPSTENYHREHLPDTVRVLWLGQGQARD